MARYRSYSRRKARRWIYGVSALVIVALVVVFIYVRKPSGKTDSGISGTSVDTKDQIEMKSGFETKLPEASIEYVVEPNSASMNLISQAMACVNAKPARIIEARDLLDRALKEMPLSIQEQRFVKEQLSILADEWLFSKKLFPPDRLCGSYKVAAGDQLSIIASQFKVPHEILMKINGISRPEALRAGDMIKVIHGPFHAKVYLSTFTMDLYLQNTFMRSYTVGIGKPGMETPSGLWSVKLKMEEPPWPDPVSGKILHPGDPNYALGSRWIALTGLEGEAVGRTGFGLHGTKEPDTIGTASSRGCIRLDNGDVIEVYDLLVPTHSQVRIVE